MAGSRRSRTLNLPSCSNPVIYICVACTAEDVSIPRDQALASNKCIQLSMSMLLDIGLLSFKFVDMLKNLLALISNYVYSDPTHN